MYMYVRILVAFALVAAIYANSDPPPQTTTMSNEEAWRVKFDEFDADGSGELSVRELIDVFVNLGQSDEDSKANASHIINQYDLDDNGKISWNEFKAAMEGQGPPF